MGKRIVEHLQVAMSARDAALTAAWRRQANNLGRFERRIYRARRALHGLFTAVGAFAVAHQLAGAARLWGKYEEALGRVQAKSEATNAMMKTLSSTIRDAARQTKYTAKQTADAAAFLAQAGYRPNEINQAIRPILDLAAATGTGVAQTADIASNIQIAMGEPVSRLTHIAEVLSVTSDRTNTNLIELGESMKYAAPVAKDLGVDVAELSTLLGYMANAGIKASTAGTAFRRALAQLAGVTTYYNEVTGEWISTANKQNDTLERLGVQVRNKDGTLRNFLDILQDLAAAGATAEDAVKIFGTQAGTKLAVLLRAGKGEMRAFADEIREIEGLLAKKVKLAMDNLSGDFMLLKSQAQESTLVVGESGATKAFRDFTQSLTSLLDESEPVMKFLGRLINSFSMMGKIVAGVATNIAAITHAAAKVGNMGFSNLFPPPKTKGGAAKGRSGYLGRAGALKGETPNAPPSASETDPFGALGDFNQGLLDDLLADADAQGDGGTFGGKDKYGLGKYGPANIGPPKPEGLGAAGGAPVGAKWSPYLPGAIKHEQHKNLMHGIIGHPAMRIGQQGDTPYGSSETPLGGGISTAVGMGDNPDITQSHIDEMNAKLKDQGSIMSGLKGSWAAYGGEMKETLAMFAQRSKGAAKLLKAISIVEATINAYRAYNVALATYPPPAGQIMAGISLALGMAKVAAIASQNVAHGGMSQVPATASYTLLRGERVVSDKQNKDLSAFLSSQRDAEGAWQGAPAPQIQIEIGRSMLTRGEVQGMISQINDVLRSAPRGTFGGRAGLRI